MTLTFLMLASIFLPVAATAQHHGAHFSDTHTDADVVPRLAHKHAEKVITTREGSVELLLTKEAVLMQFSDHFFDDLEEEIHEDDEYAEASLLGDIIQSMVSSGLKTFLDHGLSIPLYEISDISYTDGKLQILNHDGEEIFDDLDINDTEVMRDFSRRDARRFAAAAERYML